MEPEIVGDFTHQIIDFIGSAPVWLSCATLLFCAAIEYVFPPFPGDTALVAGGFFIAQGAIPFVPAGASLILGSILGTAAGWYLGLLAQRSERTKKFVFKVFGEKNFEKILFAYARHGNLMLVLNRFIPGVRGVFVLGAGFTGIPFSSVMIFGTISSLLWVSLLIGAGFILSEQLSVLMYVFKTYSQIVVLGFAALVAIWFLRSYLRKRR